MSAAVRIVTGAASGIGRATAERLAREDCLVVCADIDAVRLRRVAAEIGERARAVTADLADASACQSLVQDAASLGRIDTLVNVAGVMSPDDSVETLPDEELERVLAVNVKAIFRLGRHVVPELRRLGGGVIVNVASVHAFATMTRVAAYAASKGAITALTRQMAIDLAPDGIRVAAVAPGSVDTPLTRLELGRRGLTPEQAGFPTGRHAIGRIATPEEIAEVIAWLRSDAAAVVNGSTVIADSGLLTRLV
jgi:NAD(P)-dependent dehydrogenase (short-subunit alcohol dehydrogenase family)